jgi:lysophospholipase L1-like esterase
MMRYKILLSFFLLGFSVQAQIFPENAKRVLFIGNSITYAGRYVQIIEAYQRAKYPGQEIEIFNLGLPSETVSGLSEEGHAGGRFPRPDLHERLARVLEQIKPDLVFATYGMNDGIYLPLEETRFQKFKDGIIWLHDQVISSGAKIIHITPSLYEEKINENIGYGKVLDEYSLWLVDQKNWQVIDTHRALQKYLSKELKMDVNFRISKDGVHPGDQGHWVMAKEILRYLGAKKLGQINSVDEMLDPMKDSKVFFDLIVQRHTILKDAWLTKIGHKRPEMKKGLPMNEANLQAADFMKKIKEFTP